MVSSGFCSSLCVMGDASGLLRHGFGLLRKCSCFKTWWGDLIFSGQGDALKRNHERGNISGFCEVAQQ